MANGGGHARRLSLSNSIHSLSPLLAFISPYFFRRMACTLMKPVVSLGANEPISSMELSLMSYRCSVAELRPSTAKEPLYTRHRNCPFTDVCDARMEPSRNSRSGEKYRPLYKICSRGRHCQLLAFCRGHLTLVSKRLALA